MNEYYVWNTEAEAQAALDYINNTDWFPIVGLNAATGQPEPYNQRTIKWADYVLERVDGKWCFPRISSARLDSIGVPQEDRDAFLITFNPIIEEYSSDWFDFPSSSSSSGI